jgi:RNA polymerase sigma-70 factor (ECF subfamily)
MRKTLYSHFNLQDGTDLTSSSYEEFSENLLRRIARRVRHRADAADILHDVFCRFVNIYSRSRIENPTAYLIRAADNAAIDWQRSARMRFTHHNIATTALEVHTPSFARQVEARDMLRRVEAAMLQLRPRTREVFMARRVEGLSYAEISERTGLSFKIIEKEMARAIAHINRAVGRD